MFNSRICGENYITHYLVQQIMPNEQQISTPIKYKMEGHIIHLAQGAAQVFLLVSARRSSHFPVLRLFE